MHMQLYSREKSIGKSTRDQREINPPNGRQRSVVNYATSRMLKPHEGSLRRQYQKGLWLQLRNSAHQV